MLPHTHERYQPDTTLLHQLDPRVKLITTVLLIVGILLTPERAWPAYPLLWTVLGSLAAIGRLGVWRLARLGGIALPFTLAALTLLFTTPGQPVLSLLGLTITDAGVARFISIVLKSWLAAQTALLLSMTTPFTDLLWALQSLRLPTVMVMIIAFMYRYLFTLKDESERLLRARASRSGTVQGHRGGGNLSWRAQVAGGMVGSLFLRSYERSERVYAAVLSRGYRAQARLFNPPPLTWHSIAQGAIPIVALAVIQLLALLWWSR